MEGGLNLQLFFLIFKPGMMLYLSIVKRISFFPFSNE